MSSNEWKSKTVRTNVKLLRLFYKIIPVKQQCYNRNNALNLGKLLFKLLLKSLFYHTLPTFFLPWAQPSNGADWPQVHAISIFGGFQDLNGQGLEQLCLLCLTSELVCFKLKTGAENFWSPSLCTLYCFFCFVLFSDILNLILWQIH